MEKYDIIIIGAGLGGLSCGCILAKHGLNVCILEKEHQAGGAFQCYNRKENRFDTGFHYVGGVGKGELLYPLIKYFKLENLPWHKLDENFFEEIILNGKSYRFANGYDAYVDSLAQSFPDERKNLKKYVDKLNSVGSNIYASIDSRWNVSDYDSFSISAYRYLSEIFSSPTLRDVVAGGCVKTQIDELMPLYSFVQSTNSFIQGSYRIQGGGKRLIDSMQEYFIELGGNIKFNACVDELVEKEGKIESICIENSDPLIADHIISDVHPAVTLSLIKESQTIRNIYRKRIGSLENTYGMFTTEIIVKPKTLPYLNRGVYVHNTDDLWHNCFAAEGTTKNLFINYSVPNNGDFATVIDLITPMYFNEVAEWSDTSIGKRGDKYKDFKRSKALQMIDMADRVIPGLKNNTVDFYTSTPLTYRDYTATPGGSAYGIKKDYKSILKTVISPKTPLANLLYTGQNVAFHGFMGILMTAFKTCSFIIDSETLINDLNPDQNSF